MGVTITFLPEQNCEMKMKSSTIQHIKDHLVGIRAGFMLAWLLYSYLIFREDPENRYKVKYFSYSSLILILKFRDNTFSTMSRMQTNSAAPYGQF